MDTEQQQELQSEKQTTKQKRKAIPFTDKAIGESSSEKEYY